MSSGVTLQNIGSLGSASQEQLEYFTSKFGEHLKSLKEQYEEDRLALDKLGITAQQIADKCEVIFLKAMDLLENRSFSGALEICKSAIIEGKFKIKGFAIRTMSLPYKCPFAVVRLCGQGSAEFTIKNLNTKEKITIHELMLHVMRVHELFGRPGKPMRIDPLEAIRVLELSPDVDYSKELQVRNVWERVRVNGCEISTCPEVHKQTLKTTALESIAIDSVTTAFLMKTRHVEKDPEPETASSDSDFDLSLYLTPIESTIPLEEEKEGDLYLHVVGTDESCLKNVDVFGRRIEFLPIEKNDLSVYKPGTKKYAAAGAEDHLSKQKDVLLKRVRTNDS